MYVKLLEIQHCGVGHDGRAERNTYAHRSTLDWIFIHSLGKFVYLRPDYLHAVFPCVLAVPFCAS